MSNERTCSKCGANLAGFITHGVCPACLLEVGLLPNRPALSPRLRFGDYELIDEVARGGMGVVYRARQVSLNRTVAVKMVLSGALASDKALQRFRAEAEIAAGLQHPNIVRIHEVGEHEGQPFFSMDLVEGRSLADIARHEPLPARRTARYVKIVAEAVHYAHARGILHRDLKPSNILIDESDQPRVTDFGLAKQLDAEKDFTITGQVLGSPNYMPPEQATGQNDKASPAGDVYSLGAILYQLLTGRPPFMAETLAQTLRLVEESEVAAPRLLNGSVPRDLETICLKCLEKETARRYSDAAQLAEDLGRFLSGEPVAARPLGNVGKVLRWSRRHPAIASLSAAVGLLVLLTATIATVAAVRLQKANDEGLKKLWESYLAQARANRWSGQAGRRFDSLETIQKAARIKPSIELRNEAIAALALADVKPIQEIVVQPGEKHAFDGSYAQYACAKTNGEIIIRRTADNREVARMPGEGIPLAEFGFSPKGRFLATAHRWADERGLRVWEVSNGQVPLTVPEVWVRTFRFSADERLFALVDSEWRGKVGYSQVIVFDMTTFTRLIAFPLSSFPMEIVFTADATRLAVSSAESSVLQIYSVDNGSNVLSLTHSNFLHGVAWHPDGRRLAAACYDQYIYVWDISAHPPTFRRLSQGGVPTWLTFNQRGNLLASAGWNFVGRIWDVESGTELLRLAANSVSHFSLDDSRIGVHERHSGISRVERGDECRFLHHGSSSGAHDVVFSRDGRWLASGHRDGMRFWDVETGKATLIVANRDVGRLQLAPDRNTLVARTSGEVLSWPIETRKSAAGSDIIVGSANRLSREAPVDPLPANRMVCVANSKAYIFDAQTYRIERRLTSARGVYTAVMSPDGLRCATWDLNSAEVGIWNAGNGQQETNLPAPQSAALGFSPDGKWFLTGSPEEYILWKPGAWTKHQTISRGRTGSAHGRMAFTYDGRIVALAMKGGEVQLFDLQDNLVPLATLEPPEVRAISGLTFSPDGTRLAVSTTGPSILLWDLHLVREQLAQMNLDWPSPALHPRAMPGALTFSVVTPPAVSPSR